MPRDDLSLSPSTFMCRTEGHAVFLNVEMDQYFCIDEAVLDQGLAGRETPDHHIADLIAAGLLMEGAGRALSPTRLELPIADCSDFGLDRHVTIGLRHGRAFLTAITGTLLWLRLGSLQRAVLHARAVQRRCDNPIEELRELVEIFTRLRPLAFTGINHCLFDSFAMAAFLAAFGHKTRIVFAVRLRPFGAHCWLQTDTLVLNDTVDHVAGFTPIMVI